MKASNQFWLLVGIAIGIYILVWLDPFGRFS